MCVSWKVAFDNSKTIFDEHNVSEDKQKNGQKNAVFSHFMQKNQLFWPLICVLFEDKKMELPQRHKDTKVHKKLISNNIWLVASEVRFSICMPSVCHEPIQNTGNTFNLLNKVFTSFYINSISGRVQLQSPKMPLWTPEMTLLTFIRVSLINRMNISVRCTCVLFCKCIITTNIRRLCRIQKSTFFCKYLTAPMT